MTTDAWASAEQGFARLLSRGRPERREVAVQRLERSRQELAGRTGAGLEQARAEQEAAWRLRLSDLLEDDPAAEAELRVLVATFGTSASASGPGSIAISGDNSGITSTGANATNVQMQAEASGSGRVYQSGRDQTITER
ncbi:hypothetical protein OIE67_16090 [Nonomuraea fuscirosea]|uniref:hypothetical protein n=1 Tax=Nonomuraea fuscirosea TaxID=1291556 RepID=UPI002DD99DF2|nr:hypothetical protein [Nonomuraea fuscirosea]WSA56062.1 hypothetical protein OIE67_16090 [Nonomuraea fuscirosea]